MEKNNKKESDLRYRKTESLIRRTFYDMMAEMDFGQVTVKELAQRAQINRKTFYLHYQTLDVLLAALQVEILRPMMEATAAWRFPEDMEAAANYWFRFSDALVESDYKILSARGNYPAGKDPWEYVFSHCGDFFGCFSDHPLEKRLIGAFWGAAFRDVFFQWVLDGRKQSLEQVIKLMCRIMSDGLCSLDLDRL